MEKKKEDYNNRYFLDFTQKEFEAFQKREGRSFLLIRLLSKISDFINYLNQYDVVEVWKSCFMYYNATYRTKGRVNKTRHLTNIVMNDFRTFINTLINMITKEAPALKAVNITDGQDPKTPVNADAILEYYQKEYDIDTKVGSVVRMAALYGLSYICVDWDYMLGERVETEKEKAYEGDIFFEALSPLDVYYDCDTRCEDDIDWYIVKRWMSVYELQKEYPNTKIKHVDISGGRHYSSTYIDEDFYLGENPNYYRNEGHLERGTDERAYRYGHSNSGGNYSYGSANKRYSERMMFVYTLYHKKTKLVPNGAKLVFTEKQLLKYENDLKYDRIPIYRFQPYFTENTTLPYSNAFDLLSLQRCKDRLDSQIITDTINWGRSIIFAPNTPELHDLGGLKVISSGPDAALNSSDLKAINLLNFPQEVMTFRNVLSQAQEKAAGINSAARGGEAPSQQSGKAMALSISMALVANSNMEKSYVRCYKYIGEHILNVLRVNLLTTKKVMIKKKDKSGTYSWADLNKQGIAKSYKIDIELGQPLSRTIAGRLGMAEFLTNFGANLTMKDIISIINTGRLTEDITSIADEEKLIYEENNMLKAGKDVMLTEADDHMTHVKLHKVLLLNMEIRRNEPLKQKILEHIARHMEEASIQQASPMGQQAADQMKGGGVVDPEKTGKQSVSAGLQSEGKGATPEISNPLQ